MSASEDARMAIEIARIADDLKAENVTVMDLRGLSPVADYFVICSGTSDRQMRAVCDEVVDHAKRLNQRPLSVTGYETAHWILVDLVNVVMHIFTPKHREYYDLELLWGDAPRLDWSRSASA